ncbi:MAG: excinuclease ABC subunit UvrC [Nitrososphaerota archaeon]|nr:excinuclease ABC subunit UvrC [Nitrososphaerota archaeon]
MPEISPQEVVSTPQNNFDALPERPGVYILKNEEGTPIYVGKATSIKGRVLAHLRPRLDDPIGRILRDQIRSADYIFTQSSVEALILENVMIKKYKPRYNIRLKDDKSYPHIKISNEAVPRVLVTRKIEDDGADYFGPYGNVRAARRTVKYLRKMFPIRGCNLPLDWEKKFKPCIDRNIGLCKAPCIFAVSKDEYEDSVRKFKLFLDGKLVQLSKMMYDEMWKASENEEFERASKIRNDLKSLETTALKQRISFRSHTRDKDVVTIARQGEIAAAIVFEVREGNVVGREKFILDGVNEGSNEGETISSFIKQYYSRRELTGEKLPQEIVIPMNLPDMEDAQLLIHKLGPPNQDSLGKLVLHTSSEENKRLMKLAQDNAVLVLIEEESKTEVRKRERLRSLKDLKEVLELGKLPKRIECYDISNIRGKDAVGAMTVFVDGFPEKSQYRKFKIRTVSKIDDYSMMAEMIDRRFRRLKEGEEGKRWSQPDLVVIDGGKGHLRAALDQMHKDGIFGIPTISLAKREELVFRQDRALPLRLGRDSEALHILQHIRDEAHRFGITYHKNLRSRKITRSVLDEIPGVGEKRKKNLLAHFGSVEAIKRSSIEEISQVAKISFKLAQDVVRSLNS